MFFNMFCEKVNVLCLFILVSHLKATPLQPIAKITKGVVLNEFIRHYEPANYDVQLLREQHRTRRSVSPQTRSRSGQLRLELHAHGRTFRLQLRQDPSVFSEDVVFESTRGTVQYDPTAVYTGHLQDDEESTVHGVITSEGLFDGTISTKTDHYYIEPISRYLTSYQSGEPPPAYHSIIYKHSDVLQPSSNRMPCASNIINNRNIGNNKIEEVNRVEGVKRRWTLDDIHKVSDDGYKTSGNELQWKEKGESKRPSENRTGFKISKDELNPNSTRERRLISEGTHITIEDALGTIEDKHRRKKRAPLDIVVEDKFPERKKQKTTKEESSSKKIQKIQNVHEVSVREKKTADNDFNREKKGSSEKANVASESILSASKDGISKKQNRESQSEIENKSSKQVSGVPEDGLKASGNELHKKQRIPKKFTSERPYETSESVLKISEDGLKSSDFEKVLRGTEIIPKSSNEEVSRKKPKEKQWSSENTTKASENVLRASEVTSSDNPSNTKPEVTAKVHLSKNSTKDLLDILKTSENLKASSNDLKTEQSKKEKGSFQKSSENSPKQIRLKRWLPDDVYKSSQDELNFWHPNNSRHPLNPPFDLNIQDGDDLVVLNKTSDILFRHVNKRATVDPKKTTCMLYLQADHQFFQKYGTEEACIEVMTRHVQRVNMIYKITDFNQDGKPDNITFMIKRIKVHTAEAIKDPLYRFPNNYGVEKFLELFSEEDYDAFCLAYMFTYRDFEMGTLGLAWTGDMKNAGGVCEKNGHYRGSMKSLNTGIVTLLNYGKHVPPAVSHVTLAHEIGHNFGSPHDPELCTPGGEDGNFIMFARATSGDKKNNNHFSPCSIKSINPVLNFKARSPKGCFTEPQVALCGNGVVEAGEECDCGWEEDCRDECCYPQRRYPPADEPPCKLTPKAICSPSQGPCCTAQCQLKFGDKCRDDNGCRDASFCNGRDPQCPPSINKPNKTICNAEFVCFMGECTGSICLAYGLESCQCIPSPGDSKTKACELCCKLPGDNQPCLSSFEWNDMPYDVPDMYSKPGTPCNDYNGYCDVFQKCREVDPSGPLATLRKMLLSEESIASFKKWVMDHWYAVTLIIIGVFTLIVITFLVKIT